MKPGFGLIWQGGWINRPKEFALPGPLIILSLENENYGNDSLLVDGAKVCGSMFYPMEDWDTGVLTDNQMEALVESLIAFLSRGFNLYIHCMAGVSRSTYVHAALRMKVLHIPYNEAVEQIAAKRPIADPNTAFLAHLRRLEAVWGIESREKVAEKSLEYQIFHGIETSRTESGIYVVESNT